MEEKKKKKGNLKWLIIAIIVIVVLAVAGIGGWFAYQTYEANRTTGTDWGDIYYAYLEKEQDSTTQFNTIQKGSENYKVQFIPQEEKNPIMTVQYEVKVAEDKTQGKYGIFYINEESQVQNAVTYIAENRELNLELLYNKKEEQYKWYIKSEDENGNYGYNDLEKAIELSELAEELGGMENAMENETYQKLNSEATISFQAKEMPPEEIKEDTAISKFEETFIEPENVTELKTVVIEDLADLKDTKKQLTEAVEEYKPIEEITTEEVKQTVIEANQKIEDRKENIKKKEEEAKKKAEEEARKKAAEEAAKGLKVGKYRLKYGTYVSDVARMDSSMYGTIILRANGTFHIKANCEGGYPYPKLDCDGTYKVGRELNSFEYQDALKFTTNTGVKFSLFVVNNNSLNDQWHGYSYTGN